MTYNTYDGTIKGKFHAEDATLGAALADFLLVKDDSHFSVCYSVMNVGLNTRKGWDSRTPKKLLLLLKMDHKIHATAKNRTKKLTRFALYLSAYS